MMLIFDALHTCLNLAIKDKLIFSQEKIRIKFTCNISFFVQYM